MNTNIFQYKQLTSNIQHRFFVTMLNCLFKSLLVTFFLFVFTPSYSYSANLTLNSLLVEDTEFVNASDLSFQFSFYYRPFNIYNGTENGCINGHQIEYFFTNFSLWSDTKLSETTTASNPSSVFLEMKNEKNETIGVCNGNLLTSQWVLTTSFCLETFTRPFSLITVHAGVPESAVDANLNGSQSLDSDQFFVNNEVGIIKLNRSFELTSTVNTVNLSLDSWNFTSYKNCVFSGHELGRFIERAEKVKKTTLFDVAKPCFCSHRLEQDLSWGKNNPWFCSEPVKFSICPDFLGSSLICEGKLVGLAAMDVSVRNMRKCALNVNHFCTRQRKGGVTVNVFQSTCQYLKWINSYVNMVNDSKLPANCDVVEYLGKARPWSDLVLFFVGLNALVAASMLICGRLIFKLYTKTQ